MNLSGLVANLGLHHYNLRKKERLDYATLYRQEYGDESSTSDDDDGIYNPSDYHSDHEVSSSSTITDDDLEDNTDVSGHEPGLCIITNQR